MGLGPRETHFETIRMYFSDVTEQFRRPPPKMKWSNVHGPQLSDVRSRFFTKIDDLGIYRIIGNLSPPSDSAQKIRSNTGTISDFWT